MNDFGGFRGFAQKLYEGGTPLFVGTIGQIRAYIFTLVKWQSITPSKWNTINLETWN